MLYLPQGKGQGATRLTLAGAALVVLGILMFLGQQIGNIFSYVSTRLQGFGP